MPPIQCAASQVHCGLEGANGHQPVHRAEPRLADAGPGAQPRAAWRDFGLGPLHVLLHPEFDEVPDRAARDRNLVGSARARGSPGQIYHLGDDIFVCTFTHSTLDFNLACSRTNYMGTLLELTLLEGFRVGNVTGNHRDVILPPNARFAVTSAPVRRLTGFAERGGPPKTKMRRSLVVVATKRNWWTSSSCSSSLTRCPSRKPGLGSQRRACAALAPCLRGSCACAVDLGRAAHRPRRTRMR